MKQKDSVSTQTNRSIFLDKKMLPGAVLAIILISVLLLKTGEANPEWPMLWMVKPLIIVP